MRRITDTSNPLRGACVAIGNFDGVHLGHQAVLDLTRQAGTGPWGVMTFEPHPRTFFAAAKGLDLPPFRLMHADARAHRLEKLGADVVIEVPFNEALVELSPEAFAKDLLVDAYGVSGVVVGSDFRFGKDRAGTAEDLQDLGAQYGFKVTLADLALHGDKTISSTNIRAALTEANPRLAADMLGHWHRIEGEVLHGEKRGRELGYPTANMSLDGLHQPAFGVYAVTVDIRTGPQAGTYHGAASIGVRPMFGENRPNIETFLFDFAGDLYGQTLSVGLVEFLRPELKFDGLEELITQMDADCAKARSILDAL